MNQVWIPEGYESCLGLYDTQKAIGLIKNLFQQKLCLALHLKRVTAPLFVTPSSGLNDDLNGVERPVGFDIPAVDGGGGEGRRWCTLSRSGSAWRFTATTSIRATACSPT